MKDGEFRQFRGSRNVKDFLDYVEEKQWQNTEPISSWQSPGSFQMGILGKLISFGKAKRTFYTILVILGQSNFK